MHSVKGLTTSMPRHVAAVVTEISEIACLVFGIEIFAQSLGGWLSGEGGVGGIDSGEGAGET